jgi:Gpi18-like mannosyltransferase
VSYHAYLFFGNSLEIWRLILKLPIIFAHLACAYLVGLFIANRFGKKTGVTVLLVTLTWLFFIYVGAIWGQIDTISALLTFLAFYAILTKQKFASAFLLGVAITLKLYPIVVLPAFFIYVLKNWNLKEAGKYLLYALAVPAIFTLAIFGFYKWDIVYFLKTILYTTPVFTSNPTQINEGCMNFFSFITLQNRTQSFLPALRLIWIPALAVATFVWWKKPRIDEIGLTVSIISFYLIFMVTYSWVTEQTFLGCAALYLPFDFCISTQTRLHIFDSHNSNSRFHF